jgi:hypothetical protein
MGLGLGPLAIVLPLLCGCNGGGGEDTTGSVTPEEIRGHWITDQPEYADRGLEIIEDALVFHTGEETFDLHMIREIRAETVDGGVEFELDHWGKEGVSMTFSFIYNPADTTIRFKNQPRVIWVRGGEGIWHGKGG